MTNAPFAANASSDIQRSGASLSLGVSFYF
jgi:hypothetical protein